MEKSKKEKNAEVAEHVITEFQKMITGFIPGSHVAEGFWSFRSQLKQKRLLDFAESVKKVFEGELSVDLDTYNFESEDFMDIFESVMIKVQATKSDYKLERFRNILINHIVDPVQDILTIKYVELLDSINEVQLILLDAAPHYERNISFQMVIMNLSKEDSADNMMRVIDKNVVKVLISKQNVPIDLDDVDFYINDLVSKGLIDRITKEEGYDVPHIGGMDKQSELVTKYRISKTGIKFLKFIRNYE